MPSLTLARQMTVSGLFNLIGKAEVRPVRVPEYHYFRTPRHDAVGIDDVLRI